jgi:hypothetical protein
MDFEGNWYVIAKSAKGGTFCQYNLNRRGALEVLQLLLEKGINHTTTDYWTCKIHTVHNNLKEKMQAQTIQTSVSMASFRLAQIILIIHSLIRTQPT